VKIWLFLMFLATPGGNQPPHLEPMDSLDACVAKIVETQKSMTKHDETFKFTAACVQDSTKGKDA
jgi:hypothetical protein